VIVPPEAFDLWLDCAKVDATTATALVAPAPEGSMAVREISPAVNRVANDSPELLEPYREPEVAPSPPKPASRAKVKPDTGQGSLF
jgi:putative SOS response-associated peptidase YedK